MANVQNLYLAFGLMDATNYLQSSHSVLK